MPAHSLLFSKSTKGYVYIFGFKGVSTSQVIGARNEMMMDYYDGQMIFGDLVGLKLPDIRLTGEEKPRKTSPRKLVLTGDRTRAHCVTSAHATTCSTAVDSTKGATRLNVPIRQTNRYQQYYVPSQHIYCGRA